MPIVVTGLKELRAELKALDKTAPREINAALREGAKVVTARAVQYAPEKDGDLRGSARPFSTARAAGVRFTVPYAGVQEFAVNWYRHNRGPKGSTRTGGAMTKAQKKHLRDAGGGGGVNEVHYTKNGPPPRFAYKAVEELAEGLMAATFERLVNILKCHGWFR